MTDLLRGRIEWVHPSHQYGFITYTDDNGEEQSIFVHQNNLLAWRGGKNSKPPKTLLDENGKLRRPRLRFHASVSFVIGEWEGGLVAKRVYQLQPRKRKKAVKRKQQRQNKRRGGGGDWILPVTRLPG